MRKTLDIPSVRYVPAGQDKGIYIISNTNEVSIYRICNSKYIDKSEFVEVFAFADLRRVSTAPSLRELAFCVSKMTEGVLKSIVLLPQSRYARQRLTGARTPCRFATFPCTAGITLGEGAV